VRFGSVKQSVRGLAGRRRSASLAGGAAAARAALRMACPGGPGIPMAQRLHAELREAGQSTGHRRGMAAISAAGVRCDQRDMVAAGKREPGVGDDLLSVDGCDHMSVEREASGRDRIAEA
jgi:hypothetical protein